MTQAPSEPKYGNPLTMLLSGIVFLIVSIPVILLHASLKISLSGVLPWTYSAIVAATLGATFWLSKSDTPRPSSSEKPTGRVLLAGYLATLLIIAVIVVGAHVVAAFLGAAAALLFALAYTAFEVEMIKRERITPALVLVALILVPILMPVIAAARLPTKTRQVASALDAIAKYPVRKPIHI